MKAIVFLEELQADLEEDFPDFVGRLCVRGVNLIWLFLIQRFFDLILRDESLVREYQVKFRGFCSKVFLEFYCFALQIEKIHSQQKQIQHS